MDLFILHAKFNAFVMQMSKLIFRWWKISSEPLLSSILTWKRNGWMSPSESSFIPLGVCLITCFSSHYTITLSSETAIRMSGFFITASLARLCPDKVVLGFLKFITFTNVPGYVSMCSGKSCNIHHSYNELAVFL